MIIQGNISVYGGKVFISNKPMPMCPSHDTRNVKIIAEHIYIGGYELVNEHWKKTIKAIWYKYFN